MPTINDFCNFMDRFAPVELAEDWDNVGLLVGDPQTSASRIMTCLTITPESAQEAIAQKADLIVSHHPMPFRPLKRLTTCSTSSRLLLDLIRAGTAIYSPHTGFDSAEQGINQQLAELFGTSDSRPLIPASPTTPNIGSARVAETTAPCTLADFVNTAKRRFELSAIQYVGELGHPVQRVAFACGSGGSFLDLAIREKCDTFVTGETNFHTCLEAKSAGINLLLLGHHSSERFALDILAKRLQEQFPATHVWASEQESDPLKWA